MTSRQDEVDGRPREFGITTQELQALMESRGHEGYQTIQAKYGGVTELCKKLYTSPSEGKCCSLWMLFSHIILVVSNHFELPDFTTAKLSLWHHIYRFYLIICTAMLHQMSFSSI
jgi:hypothetical protein